MTNKNTCGRMKILVKNNKERVKNQEVEMKKVQKLLRRSPCLYLTEQVATW